MIVMLSQTTETPSISTLILDSIGKLNTKEALGSAPSKRKTNRMYCLTRLRLSSKKNAPTAKVNC